MLPYARKWENYGESRLGERIESTVSIDSRPAVLLQLSLPEGRVFGTWKQVVSKVLQPVSRFQEPEQALCKYFKFFAGTYMDTGKRGVCLPLKVLQTIHLDFINPGGSICTLSWFYCCNFNISCFYGTEGVKGFAGSIFLNLCCWLKF